MEQETKPHQRIQHKRQNHEDKSLWKRRIWRNRDLVHTKPFVWDVRARYQLFVRPVKKSLTSRLPKQPSNWSCCKTWTSTQLQGQRLALSLFTRVFTRSLRLFLMPGFYHHNQEVSSAEMRPITTVSLVDLVQTIKFLWFVSLSGFHSNSVNSDSLNQVVLRLLWPTEPLSDSLIVSTNLHLFSSPSLNVSLGPVSVPIPDRTTHFSAWSGIYRGQ